MTVTATSASSASESPETANPFPDRAERYGRVRAFVVILAPFAIGPRPLAQLSNLRKEGFPPGCSYEVGGSLRPLMFMT